MNTDELLAGIDEEIARLEEVRRLLGGGDGAGIKGSKPGPEAEEGYRQSEIRKTDDECGWSGKNCCCSKGQVGKGEEGLDRLVVNWASR